MGRRVRYQVAVSLDGFIAGPNGEYDWIVMDPSIDFAALFKEFDTAIMGRKTYEMATAQGGNGSMPGRDIWLYGGGDLFRSLLIAGLVDTVEVAVMPVLIGSGIPLLPPGATTKLKLTDQKTLPASGIVALSYSIPGGAGPAPRIGYVKPAKARPKKKATARPKKKKKAR